MRTTFASNRRPGPWWARWLLLAAGLLAGAPVAMAQARPYIGFVYPAGGQRGTTFQARLGGQALENVRAVRFTGAGVSSKVLVCYRRLNGQDITLLNEQLKELRRSSPPAVTDRLAAEASTATPAGASGAAPAGPASELTPSNLIARIERRIAEHCDRPASVSLAGLVFVEVTIAPDAAPGARELRLETPTGVSNPMVFHVGQLPEFRRAPMVTSRYQVLGKEAAALRKRPVAEAEDRITLPCTVNGQVASGEVNRYRFSARQGQRLVITTQARRLIPYVADAVPGWFQPVLELCDARGKEVAYDDDYRFDPDPTILYRAPADGEYVAVIHDSLYRGREDFVYRLTLGEQPFLTSVFPLGGRAGEPAKLTMTGWNLGAAALTPPAKDAAPGIYSLATTQAGLVSNPVSFALDALPNCPEKEPNDTVARAQKVRLPVVINGRINRLGDSDVFQFVGRAGETIVAEVQARRLGSPLDSVLKLTDGAGKLLAWNDDFEDLEAGLETHHADSYLMFKLPADGTYFAHLGDTASHGGEEYGYRLRLSAPRPDFALRVIPSSIGLRRKSSATVTVRAIRKDGFTGPIRLALNHPPPGFAAAAASLSGTQEVATLTVKTDLTATKAPVRLSVVGSARIQDEEVTHEAAPAEDRMQAFLWRHLVPAEDLVAVVFDPNEPAVPNRVPRPLPPAAFKTNSTQTNATQEIAPPGAGKPKFSKQQVAARLRELKRLFEEGLLTDEFYEVKVAECDAAR